MRNDLNLPNKNNSGPGSKKSSDQMKRQKSKGRKSGKNDNGECDIDMEELDDE